jgi:CheY-like chemotaxis protein
VLETIEEMSPPAEVKARSPQWRAYRILSSRFVEGMSPREVVEELAVSERQFYREQRKALDGFTHLFAEKCEWIVIQNAEDAPEKGSDVEREAGHTLQTEVERLASEAETVCLEELVVGAIRATTPLAEAKGVAVFSPPCQDLPSIHVNAAVARQMLIQLLSNLIVQPGVEKVDLTSFYEEAHVWVEVTASGSSDILEPLDIPEQNTVRYLVHMLGGRWEEERSRENVCRIRFSLAPNLPRILLCIEDNPAAVKLLRRYLTQHGYRVIGVDNGLEALSLVRQCSPDFILLDIMMPERDGWQILRDLRAEQEFSSIPILVCSVLEEQELATAMGADGYLKKPFSQTELLRTLDATCSR